MSLGEHHQSPDGYISSPLVVAGAVGACTSDIRCLVSTIVAPLHDPIRLAEDIAVADLCLGGRLDVALAAGYVADGLRHVRSRLPPSGRGHGGTLSDPA